MVNKSNSYENNWSGTFNWHTSTGWRFSSKKKRKKKCMLHPKSMVENQKPVGGFNHLEKYESQ
jgi:hypothetical protein